jgi:hypothetical protein
LTLAVLFTLAVSVGCGPSQADKDAEAFHERLMEKYQRQKDCLRMEIEMKNHYTDHQIAEYERDHNIQVGCIE